MFLCMFKYTAYNKFPHTEESAYKEHGSHEPVLIVVSQEWLSSLLFNTYNEFSHKTDYVVL